MKRNTQNKGITLVALVVTIVVLLILAGITINLVLSDDGIFKKAEEAKIQTEIQEIEERVQMIYSDKLLENTGSNFNKEVDTSEIIEQLKREGYQIEQREASAEEITGIRLDKQNITIGLNKTEKIKVIYEGTKEPFVYYVKVQEKFYKMHSNKGFITIDRKPSEINGEDESNLTVTNSDTTIAMIKEENNIIEISALNIEGEVMITVTYGSYTDTCKVVIKNIVVATSITLNENEYTVTGGQSWSNDLQLVATLKPDNVTEKEVEWKSDNPEIAIVDSNGVVKAGTKGGEVIITAMTKDGTDLLAECKITTELFGKINSSKTEYIDSDENNVQIPDGFAVGVSDNVNKVVNGLVIQDNEGNQFVWIPVGEVKKGGKPTYSVILGRYKFAYNQPIPITPVQTQENYSTVVTINSKFREYLGNTRAKELKKFIDNSITDGGYWFGRYEVSNYSGKATSKYDQSAWIRITQTEASDRAQKMKSTGVFQSDLVNSYAWDTAIIFIEKSGYEGYSNQSPKSLELMKTGRTGDKVCNINDMSSNCWEWTTEIHTTSNNSYVFRGGKYLNRNGITSYRGNIGTNYADREPSFRIILFDNF